MDRGAWWATAMGLQESEAKQGEDRISPIWWPDMGCHSSVKGEQTGWGAQPLPPPCIRGGV